MSNWDYGFRVFTVSVRVEKGMEGRGETDNSGWVVSVGTGRRNKNGIYIYEKVKKHV